LITVTQVRTKLVSDTKRNTIAYVTMTFNDSIVVRGCRIVTSEKGPFLAMPSKPHKNKEGEIEWTDICFPCTAEARKLLEAAAFADYNKVAEENGALPLS